MGASEGVGSPLAGRAQPRCSCSLTSLGAPASLKLHSGVFLIWEELGRGRLHRCAPPCSPTAGAGWPEPPDRGCPLHVSWGFLTPISALQIFPSADGTASSKAPFFCNSCSSYSLCLVQRKPRVCSQWLNHIPLPFGMGAGAWAACSKEMALHAENQQYLGQSKHLKRPVQRADRLLRNGVTYQQAICHSFLFYFPSETPCVTCTVFPAVAAGS